MAFSLRYFFCWFNLFKLLTHRAVLGLDSFHFLPVGEKKPTGYISVSYTWTDARCGWNGTTYLVQTTTVCEVLPPSSKDSPLSPTGAASRLIFFCSARMRSSQLAIFLSLFSLPSTLAALVNITIDDKFGDPVTGQSRQSRHMIGFSFYNDDRCTDHLCSCGIVERRRVLGAL